MKFSYFYDQKLQNYQSIYVYKKQIYFSNKNREKKKFVKKRKIEKKEKKKLGHKSIPSIKEKKKLLILRRFSIP
jgi:hypothetical protein